MDARTGSRVEAVKRPSTASHNHGPAASAPGDAGSQASDARERDSRRNRGDGCVADELLKRSLPPVSNSAPQTDVIVILGYD